ncbi:MAG: hypothetical protein AAFX99_10135 [Myxococcota bacterium]
MAHHRNTSLCCPLHITVALMLLVVTAAACTGIQRRGSSSQTANPTRQVPGAEPLGLCPSAPPSHAPDSELLGVTEQALKVGCPRVALQALEPLDAQMRRGALKPALEAQMLLRAAQARRQVLAAGFQHDVAPPGLIVDMTLPPWVWTGAKPRPKAAVAFPLGVDASQLDPKQLEEAAPRLLVRDVERLTQAVKEGHLPMDVVADGTLLGVAIRSVMQIPCTTTKQGKTLMAARKVSQEGLDRVLAILDQARTGQPLNSAEQRTLARLVRWQCKPKQATQVWAGLVQPLADRNQIEAVLDLAIDMVELDIFPQGQADDLKTAELSDGDLMFWAGLEETARGGSGPWAADADQFEHVMQAIRRDFRPEEFTPTHQARLAYLEALILLRLRAKPQQALDGAQVALRLAKKAQRADLADAARVVMVLAWLELDDLEAALILLDAVVASFDQRGVAGAHLHLAQRLRHLTQIHAMRGDHRSLRSALALMPTTRPELWSTAELAAQITHAPDVYLKAYLYEEAVVEFDRSIQEWEAFRGRLGEAIWVSVDATLRGRREQVEALLGRPAGLVDAEVAGEQPIAHVDVLRRAVDTNHGEAVRRWAFARPEESYIRVMLLLRLYGCGPIVSPMFGTASGVIEPMIEDTETIVSQWTTQLSQLPQAGALGDRWVIRNELNTLQQTSLFALARCGAYLGRPQLVARVGRMFQAASRWTPAGMSSSDQQLYQALSLWSQGRFQEASRSMAALAEIQMASASAASGVSQAQMAGYMLTLASQIALQDRSAPRVEEAITYVERAAARDLRVRRIKAFRQGTGAGSPLAKVEANIDVLQSRLRTLIAMAEASSGNPLVLEGLEARRNQLTAELEQARRRHQHQLTLLESDNPDAYRALALGASPDLAAIQSRLLAEEVLVYTILSPERGWAVVLESGGGVRVVELPLLHPDTGLPRLGPLLRQFQEQLDLRMGGDRGFVAARSPKRKADPKRLDALSRALYELLVKPLETVIPAGKRVIVVPSAELASLPLAALGGQDVCSLP